MDRKLQPVKHEDTCSIWYSNLCNCVRSRQSALLDLIKPDYSPYNDPVLMVAAATIYMADPDVVNLREVIIQTLASFHRALRHENAVLRAQVTELRMLQPAAVVIVSKEKIDE